MPESCNKSRGRLGSEVLVVDDEIGIRELLADHLLAQGLVVTTLSDGRAAVAALEHSNGRFGLVLTDINMPGADGFDVLRAARQANAGTKVVMLTGYGSLDSAKKAFSLGAHEYIRKPFKLGTLDGIVQEFTGRLKSEPAGTMERAAGSLCPCST
ncbi:MAG: response regulator [Acidobacteriota bacterium]